MKFEISRHAREEIERRGIPLNVVETVLREPQQVVDEYGNKKAHQSIMDIGTGKDYLVRVIVNYSVDTARVVTVYRTSKIDGLVKSLIKCFFVIPVETGIQSFQIVVCSLDACFRGYDDFLRVCQL